MFNLPLLPLLRLPRIADLAAIPRRALEPALPDLIARLPTRLQMFPHNAIGHPLMAHLDVLGLHDAANLAHDATLPFPSGAMEASASTITPCLPDSQIGLIGSHMGEVAGGSWIARPPCEISGDVTLECRGVHFSALTISEQEDAEGRITYTLDLLYQHRFTPTPERPRPFAFVDERTNLRAYGVRLDSITEVLTQMVNIEGLDGLGEV